MNPTNKLAYKRHRYSGPRKSRKKVQAAFKRHHGSSFDVYRVEAWRGNKKQKVVEETADCPLATTSLPSNEPSTSKQSPDNQQSLKNQSSTSDNVIHVFCPKCNTEVPHSAEGIQQDQTKILITKVYRYFEQEYEELKKMYKDVDLTPLSKFRQRTSLATGVSDSMLKQILREDERRREAVDRARAVKRRKDSDSLIGEDSSDDNDDDLDADADAAADVQEPEQSYDETETLVVKIEQPTEFNNDEPEIFVPAPVKVEPGDYEANNDEPEIFVPAPVKVEPGDYEANKTETLVVKIEQPTEFTNDEPEIFVPAPVKVEPGDYEPNKLNKAPKTSAERGREFRARKALLKQQQKLATEDIRSAGPSEKKQVPEPSEITTIEKRAKSVEATRRWREKKKGVSESSKKQAKTAAQRMREYRERKKLAKKILLEQQSDQDIDAVVSTSSSQVNQRAGPSTINSIAAELTRIGNSQSQQQIERSERTREYRERRNDNVNIEFEQVQTDPISLDIKTEPQDEAETTIETQELNEPTTSKRKARKRPRKTQDSSTQQHTLGESSIATTSRNILWAALEHSNLLDETVFTAEKTHEEEGFS